MTVNTPDIRQGRRGIIARLLGSHVSSTSVRHTPYSGAAPQDWSNVKWPVHTNETSASRETNADINGQPAGGRANRGPHLHPLGGWRKRALDVAVASTALVLALPLMIVAALLIKITAGGPVLFAHRRIGFNGKPFNCYKLRTMVEGAEQVLEEHLARDPRAAEEWRQSQKLKKDPRITLLGQLLRKSSFDELPQLVNVLRGEMSCVGPRPIVADELPRYGFIAGDYLRTRPGLTGLWQISGRNDVDYANRVCLDAQYVQNWSLWNDVVILAWTVVTVMRFDRTS